MAVGLFRIKGAPHGVQVGYDNIDMPLFEDQYREQGYLPHVEELPWKTEYDAKLKDQTSHANGA